MTFPQAALRYGAGRVWRQRQLPLVAPYLPAYLPKHSEIWYRVFLPRHCAIAVKGAAQSLAACTPEAVCRQAHRLPGKFLPLSGGS